MKETVEKRVHITLSRHMTTVCLGTVYTQLGEFVYKYSKLTFNLGESDHASNDIMSKLGEFNYANSDINTQLRRI